jgi:hypothetical protein
MEEWPSAYRSGGFRKGENFFNPSGFLQTTKIKVILKLDLKKRRHIM